MALLMAGVGILWFARHAAEDRAEREALEHTKSTALMLSDRLEPSDLAAPVGEARRAKLDRIFKPLLNDEFVRVKLWTKDGVVTYSDVPSLIGTRDPDELAATGAHEGPSTELGKLNDEGGTGENFDTLSAYVPIQLDGASQPAGTLELYKNFHEVNAEAANAIKPVAAALFLALLLLYASLFPILRQVTGALDARTRRLQQ
jgi:hypothetical protein